MKPKLTVAGLLIFAIFGGCSQAVAQAPPSSPTAKPISVEMTERCPTVIIYQRGAADGFTPGTDPVYPSLALDAFLQSISLPGLPAVPYDDASGCDHPFGDTFNLDECVLCCGICSATLEITMSGCGSALDCNDSVTVGQAPFNLSGGYVIWNGYINGIGCPGNPPIGVDDPPPSLERRSPDYQQARRLSSLSPTIVKTIQLDPRKLAELVCKRHVKQLDVYVQDDEKIDFMRLIITKP